MSEHHGLLVFTCLERLRLDPGGIYAIVTLGQYSIVAIGVVMAFSTLGLQWARLQWLVAALGGGLGFGLTVTALHESIYRKCAEAGIVITFPQRDVHLDTSRPLEIKVVGSNRLPEDMAHPLGERGYGT